MSLGLQRSNGGERRAGGVDLLHRFTKLKDDQLTMRAELAVLVTDKLPPNCRHFVQIDSVWVANQQCAISLAIALRHQLAEVALARKSPIGRGEKLELLHTYLTGAEFRQRVEVIVETFTAMQIDLQEERRAFLRRCTKREKQLNSGNRQYSRALW